MSCEGVSWVPSPLAGFPLWLHCCTAGRKPSGIGVDSAWYGTPRSSRPPSLVCVHLGRSSQTQYRTRCARRRGTPEGRSSGVVPSQLFSRSSQHWETSAIEFHHGPRPRGIRSNVDGHCLPLVTKFLLFANRQSAASGENRAEYRYRLQRERTHIQPGTGCNL